jgi:BNR repeat-like domain
MSARLVALALVAMAACHSEPVIELGPPEAVSRVTSVGTAPMFAVSRDGREAIAWVSAPNGGVDGRVYVSVGGKAPAELRDPLGPIEPHGEAPPKLVFDASGALGALYVVAKEVPGRRFPASALRFARSEDDGRTWSTPVSVNDDSTFGSHNFHALHAAPDGSLYVAWLDGRHGKSTAYVTRSTDGGRTWSANTRVHSGEACPCCRTAIAAASDGTVYLAWRAVLPGNVRDIVVARSTDGGVTWSAPVRAHEDDWVFDGCPHAGPSMQVDESGRVHVAWWTGKEGAAGAYYARSDDGGLSFSDPVTLGAAAFSRPAHVQLACVDEQTIVAAWDDGTLAIPRVRVRVSRDGGRTFAAAVDASAPDRAAGFPVVGAVGDSLVLAWSERSAAAESHARHSGSDGTNQNAVMPLPAVGDAEVIVRRGKL